MCVESIVQDEVADGRHRGEGRHDGPGPVDGKMQRVVRFAPGRNVACPACKHVSIGRNGRHDGRAASGIPAAGGVNGPVCPSRELHQVFSLPLPDHPGLLRQRERDRIASAGCRHIARAQPSAAYVLRTGPATHRAGNGFRHHRSGSDPVGTVAVRRRRAARFRIGADHQRNEVRVGGLVKMGDFVGR